MRVAQSLGYQISDLAWLAPAELVELIERKDGDGRVDPAEQNDDAGFGFSI